MTTPTRWRLFLLATLLAGCGAPRSMLEPGGSAARKLSDLGWPLLVGFTAVSALMWGLLVWVAMRRTGTLDEHAPISAKGGLDWVLYGGFIGPVVVLLVVFIATLFTLRAFPLNHRSDRPEEAAATVCAPPGCVPDIQVIGRQWWWEVRYLQGSLEDRFTTANEIHIPIGQTVTIELESRDVIHSFWVPRLHGKVDLVPGHPNEINLQADRPGVYQGACAEFCGPQHAHMRLVVVAEPKADYDEWLRKQRRPAEAPTEVAAISGARTFLEGPCVVCHTVRGTAARGTVGPDLTHVGSRRTLGAGSLPNQIGSLHAWVTNAPSLKPGIRMPALTQFSGDQLHGLVAYLESLH